MVVDNDDFPPPVDALKEQGLDTARKRIGPIVRCDDNRDLNAFAGTQWKLQVSKICNTPL
jgi:hypothetical protein